VRPENPSDDPVIRRVADVRPLVPEDEIAPDSPRAVAIAERVLAGESAAPQRSDSSRGRWVRPQWALPRMGLALAPIVAVVVLLLSGTFSGPDNSGTQPVAAAVIRATARALATTPGTVFVTDETYISGPQVKGQPWTLHAVQETPAGRGPTNQLVVDGQPGGDTPGRRLTLTGFSYVGGTEAVYSPVSNTIYTSSIWGPYIHPGRRPGTFVYKEAAGAPTHGNQTLTLTAGQAHALLRGEGAVIYKGPTTGPSFSGPLRAPDDAQTLHDELANHMLHYVGSKTIDGRRALELAGTTNGQKSGYTHYYVDPATHLPFKEIDRPGTKQQQVIELKMQKLPITKATMRLLSFHALYPSARVDRNHEDYVRAAHGLQVYPG
jgi:hypothetical protein